MSRGRLAFLSYARTDAAAYADEIAKRLERSGYRVAADEALLTSPGRSHQIDGEIRSADIVIVLLSRAASQSAWVESEVGLALRSNRHLIPVLLHPEGTQSALMSLVGDRAMIDAVGQEPAKVALRVADAVAEVAPGSVALGESTAEFRAASRRSIPVFLMVAVVILLAVGVFWLTQRATPPGGRTTSQQTEERRRLEAELERERRETERLRAEARAREQQLAESRRLVADGIQAARRGRLTEAIDLYREAIALDPENPEVFQLVGYALLRRSQLRPEAHPDDASAAVSFLKRAVELDPQYTWGHYNLALAQWHAGDHADAAESVRTLLGIDETFLETMEKDPQFRQLLDSPELHELVE